MCRRFGRSRVWDLTVLATSLACGGGGSGGSSVLVGDGGAGGAPGTDSSGGVSGELASSGGSDPSGAGASTSSGGEGASEGTGSAAGGSPAQGCASSTSEARVTPANLLFLLDRSGSMNCNPPNGRAELELCQGVTQLQDEDTKWQITVNALSSALQQLSTQKRVSVGLTLFPLVGGNPQDVRLPEAGPDVDIQLLSDTHSSDLQSFVTNVEPRGETPLANATLSSYELLRQKIVDRELPGTTFVVLMTDGTETASTSLLQQLVDTWVSTAYDGFGIRTFVIGAPGSEPARATLSRIAFDGDTASSPDCDHSASAPDEGDCHLDMTTSVDFAEDLAQALLDISRDRSLACDFAVPENPTGGGVNLSQVNVSFRPGEGATEEVLLDDLGECGVDAEGWQFSEDRTRIVLCGGICDRVRSDSASQVEIVLGCPTVRRIR